MRTWTVGTAEDCAVHVTEDPYVSVRHCRVEQRDDGTVWVEDLGSTNGTWISPPGSPGKPGVKVMGPVQVNPPCVLRVGRTEFLWR